MPTRNANSVTSRTDGTSHTGFVALRKEKPREELEAEEAEQYQLFETSQYKYRVFVTDFVEPIDFVVWFYGQRGGAET